MGSRDLDLTELGAGPAFGSESVTLNEVNYASIEFIEKEKQQDVLIFDWWIKNDDRCLTELGGNPNLFWDPTVQDIVVIDHNLAFAANLKKAEFSESHIFKGVSNSSLSVDFFRRAEFSDRMAKALDKWDDILNSMPSEWGYIDPEMTIPSQYNFEATRNTLDEYLQDEFWK
jgi:hypothetical protein